MKDEYIKTNAIVLEHIVYGENSIILNVFSQSLGIIGIFIKNANNYKSMIEFNPLSISEFTLKKSNQFYYIVDYDLLNSNYNLRTNYKSELFSLIIIDIIKSIFYNEACDEKIYALIIKTIIYLSKYMENQYEIINAFILKLVSFLGYQPNMFYKANKNIFSLDGGFVGYGESSYFIDNSNANYMIFLMKNKYEDIVNKKYNNIDHLKILKILIKYVMYNFGIDYLGSLNYLQYL